MLARINEEYRDRGVEILALNVIPATPLPEFVQYMKARGGGDHLYATDARLAVAQAYRVQYLGTLIVVDRDGRVAGEWGDAVSYDQLKQVVEQLLA